MRGLLQEERALILYFEVKFAATAKNRFSTIDEKKKAQQGSLTLPRLKKKKRLVTMINPHYPFFPQR